MDFRTFSIVFWKFHVQYAPENKSTIFSIILKQKPSFWNIFKNIVELFRFHLVIHEKTILKWRNANASQVKPSKLYCWKYLTSEAKVPISFLKNGRSIEDLVRELWWPFRDFREFRVSRNSSLS